MTLQEKVAQLQANSTLPPVPGLPVGPTPAFGILKKDRLDDAVARRALGNGIAAFNLVSFDPKGATAFDHAMAANAIVATIGGRNQPALAPAKAQR